MSIVLKLRNCFKVKETQLWVSIPHVFSKFHQANCLSLAFLVCNNNSSASFEASLPAFIEIICTPHTLPLIIIVNNKKRGSRRFRKVYTI